MRHFSRRSSHLCLACGFLVVHLAACTATSWRVSETAPRTLVATNPRIQVTRTDGSELVVLSPSIRADSLYGLHRFHRDGVHAELPVAIPLADIRQFAVERDDVGKSLGLTVLMVAAAAGFSFVLTRGIWGSN